MKQTKTKNKKEKAICKNCKRKYDFPSKIDVINCACGAQVFRPVKKKSPRPSAKKKSVKPAAKKGKKK